MLERLNDCADTTLPCVRSSQEYSDGNTLDADSIGKKAHTIESIGMENNDVDSKCSESDDSDKTPPLQKRPLQEAEQITPKRLKLDTVTPRTPPSPPIHSQNVSEKSCIQHISSGQARSLPVSSDTSQPRRLIQSFSSEPKTHLDKPSLQQSSIQTHIPSHNPSSCPSHHLLPSATFQSHLPPSVSSNPNPSPAISCSSTESNEVDNLFDSIISNSDSWMLDEAIFGGGGGGSSKPSQAVPVHGDKSTMDGATIQVLLAKDKMEQEKHQLLSSIEALKSELEAKNHMIAKKEDDEKNRDESMAISMQEEFTCVICHELFISAHTLSCAHSFCEFCIKEWIKTNHKCPICRKNTTSKPVHSALCLTMLSLSWRSN